jgi:hypothetical protein
LFFFTPNCTSGKGAVWFSAFSLRLKIYFNGNVARTQRKVMTAIYRTQAQLQTIFPDAIELTFA